MIISLEEYRNKVLGCWMGKNIGGTLGGPPELEWRRQVNNVSFYTQKLDGEPLPNDDLDLQLIWLVAMEEKGIDIDASILGEYWLLYITPHWAEYGNGKINMRSGLMPPLSGSFNNPYKDSCGAFIRSEIWACIAPGCPEVAAKYAYEDAIVDHGDGEGTFAEVFCAALESAAFFEKDVYKLIDIGLSYIPADCGVAKAVRCAIAAYESGRTWLEARDEMLSRYRGRATSWGGISQEDREKGFAEGQLGWDVPSNIGIIIIGWLYGEGDFEKSICITVNCGEDTDCTAGTFGALYGIMHGIDGIPEKWTKPIGRKIKTGCLNLGELGFYGGQLPADIDAFAGRLEKITMQVVQKYCPSLELSETKPTDLTGLNEAMLFSKGGAEAGKGRLKGPVYRFVNFDVTVEYVDGPYVKDGETKKIRLLVLNKYKVHESMNIRWYAQDQWTISPSMQGKIFAHIGLTELEFEFKTDKVTENACRFAVELTIDGKHTVMLVPVVLINGNLR